MSATNYDFDVFLSYSSRDKAMARLIAEKLRAANLKVWFDEWQIRPGDHIFQKIEEGLELSRILVLCMSEHVFGSDWSQLESGTFRFRDPLNRERRFIPLRLDQSPARGSLRQLAYLDWHCPDGSEALTELVAACQSPIPAPRPTEDSAQEEKSGARDLQKLSRITTPNHARKSLDQRSMHERRAHRLGRAVGPYRPISILRADTSSTTYLAERRDRGNSVIVSMRIFESAVASDGVLSMRLRAEWPILVAVNHPGIARIVDVGETDDGEPYAVSEYVDGLPLDSYCDGRSATIEARLRLFLRLCDVVQYAHTNLIVCRNLKPDDIAVTSDGALKVLNFGIARLVDRTDSDQDFVAARVDRGTLTPRYASPEQILGRQLTITSDVYTLGVILFELVTGLQPYRVSSDGQLALERSICVSNPEPPSRRLQHARREIGTPYHTASNDQLDAIARARSTTPGRLVSRLRGDLDAIIMRSLNKNPEHRYISVEQMAYDILRYLSQEPVSARQGNWVYYAQRFIKRHAVAVSAALMLLFFLLSYSIVLTLSRR